MKPALAIALLLASTLCVGRVVAQVPRIGIVEYGARESAAVGAYLEALRGLGYVEPRTLAVERRYANARTERYPELIAELVDRKVDVIFTQGHDISKVAKGITQRIPIVSAGSEDPEMSGLVANLRRPGGNVTGVTYMSPQLAAKRLELLRDAVPGLKRVAVLWDPEHADTYYSQMQSVAKGMGLEVILLTFHSVADLDRVGTAARNAGAQALFIVPSRLTVFHAKRIAELAMAHGLPAMSAYRVSAEAGCLMSYGADNAEMQRRAALQTQKILRGANPGELPIEQPTKFELVVNLKTAKALGLTVPQSILLRADRVIE